MNIGIFFAAFFSILTTLAFTHMVYTDKVDDVVKECAAKQIVYHADLCAEAEGTDPDWGETEAFYFGVKCGAYGVADCVKERL